jgi:TonB family protein
MWKRSCVFRKLAVFLSVSIGNAIISSFLCEIPAVSMQKKAFIVTGNVRVSRLVRKVLPKYSALTQEMQSTTVVLNFTIDEKGKVINLFTTGGYPLCNEAAQRAVMQWRYTPTLVHGSEPVAVQTWVKLPCGNPHGKLDPAVAQLIYRVLKGTPADPSEKNFVNGNLAVLDITLSGSLQQSVERLKALGFEITEKSGQSNLLFGMIPLNKINSLRFLPEILFVAPHRQ